MSKLTQRQIRFAREYARTLNGAASARAAGCSEKSAANTAWRWLNEDKYSHVLAYVDELLADDAAQRKIDHDILRQRLRSRLTCDIRSYYGEDGKPRKPHELTMELAQHLQSYHYSSYQTKGEDGEIVQAGENINITLSSDKKAEELLGRHSGFFKRETMEDPLSDYLQADQELARLLSKPPEEWDLDTEGESSDG